MTGPLAGVQVIELVGLGPAPHAGQLLADLGAEVIAVDRPGGRSLPIETRGKRSVLLDLKRPEAASALLRLVAGADILIEGFRPGVAERLGVGPQECRAANPRLVYGRMTGWGQSGPWAGMAGHDINYIGLTGALHAMGDIGTPPPVPLNLVGDFGGGSLFLLAGVLAALVAARDSGRGEVVDAAIIDGTLSCFGMMLSLHAAGRWSPERQANWLDGGMPFYRCYTCRDGGFMAVGALEPQFFAELLRLLEIDAEDFGPQHDRASHARQHALLEARFASRDRAHWAALFDGEDACVTPVLDYLEARDHPQMRARKAIVEAGGVLHPNRAPRFASRGAEYRPPASPEPGEHTIEVLRAAGLDDDAIDRITGGPA